MIQFDACLAQPVAKLSTGEPPEGQYFKYHRQQVVHGYALCQQGLIIVVEVLVKYYYGQPIDSLAERLHNFLECFKDGFYKIHSFLCLEMRRSYASVCVRGDSRKVLWARPAR